jgi:hypothetical protein
MKKMMLQLQESAWSKEKKAEFLSNLLIPAHPLITYGLLWMLSEHVYIYIYIFVYVYVYIYVCMYVKDTENKLV